MSALDLPTCVPQRFNGIFLSVAMHYRHAPRVLLPFLCSPTDNTKHLWEEVTEGVEDCQLAGLWTISKRIYTTITFILSATDFYPEENKNKH